MKDTNHAVPIGFEADLWRTAYAMRWTTHTNWYLPMESPCPPLESLTPNAAVRGILTRYPVVNGDFELVSIFAGPRLFLF